MDNRRSNGVAQKNVGTADRWLSAVGGVGLLLYGFRRRSPIRVVAALLGAGLIYRGTSGHSYLYEKLGLNTRTGYEDGIDVKKVVTVNTSPESAYRFWRRLENLPRFMSHLQSVSESGNGRSHWVVNAPAGITLEWDAQIMEDRPNELIAWKTVAAATVEHIGMVRFRPAPGNRGTEVAVVLRYSPPGGLAGEVFGQFLNIVTAQQIKEEVRRFKSIMEAGEVPTTKGQSSGRRSKPVDRLMAQVEEAMV